MGHPYRMPHAGGPEGAVAAGWQRPPPIVCIQLQCSMLLLVRARVLALWPFDKLAGTATAGSLDLMQEVLMVW